MPAYQTKEFNAKRLPQWSWPQSPKLWGKGLVERAEAVTRVNDHKGKAIKDGSRGQSLGERAGWSGQGLATGQ